MSVAVRFFLLVGLFGYAAALRLPETGLVGLIVADYAGFSVLYRVAQRCHAQSFARDCRELIENYNVGDELAKKLTSYWAKRPR
ncbi:MAG TPA: hypothetical protein VMI09_15625 [Candidatus Binataceae bacterium]|jgi:hypothetical protein|nr:hypothetical protein [Candidatus Binataceae bacterium]